MQIQEISTGTHEKVLFCTDTASGLRAFIALHDTTLGPGLGGCRMWPFATEGEALADVLRLSAGMTAKSALAGVPFGGGKAVIIGDPRMAKTPELLRAFGRFVDSLDGDFITGEDVGMSPHDMAVVAEETNHVSGLESGRFASGDPSPVTAEGVFRCMKVAAKARFGTGDLADRCVAIQGLGHVGMALAERVHATGARLVAADVNPAATDHAATALGATIVSPDEVLSTEAEIVAPCALGAVLNRESIPGLRAEIVCGAANNQLAEDGIAGDLLTRGVLYCPDYVVNAGGLISVAREALKIDDAGWIEAKLDAAVGTFRDILDQALRERRSPHAVAEEMVERVLREARSRGRLRA